MRILCTADYHIGNWLELLEFKEKIASLKEDYDIVVAAGDLFESYFFNSNNPYRILSFLFPGKFVVAILGNHEFVENPHEAVIQRLSDVRKYDGIHYLDLEGSVEIGGVNFVGNVLWYDDSMSKFAFRMDYPEQVKDHSDYLFNPRIYFDECCAKIFLNYDWSKRNVLVTHTCPHFKMNSFRYTGEGANTYAGSTHYLNELKFTAAICGHTHFPARAYVNGCNCINVGSSKSNFRYEILFVS